MNNCNNPAHHHLHTQLLATTARADADEHTLRQTAPQTSDTATQHLDTPQQTRENTQPKPPPENSPHKPATQAPTTSSPSGANEPTTSSAPSTHTHANETNTRKDTERDQPPRQGAITPRQRLPPAT